MISSSAPPKTPTSNVQAYDSYLRGRQYMHQFRRKSLEFALQMFARASQIDPLMAAGAAAAVVIGVTALFLVRRRKR